jgi:SAM-dependent methyltransferase
MHLRLLVAALAAFGALLLPPVTGLAAEVSKYGDAIYKPRLRQPGKDVMWLPTPDAMVTQMLRAAKVTSKDLVYDLGAGDGKIPIAAAKQFGARAVGIEYEPNMAALAQRNAKRAKVSDKVKIIQGDIFKEDFSAATVVTLYLLPDLNHQLRPTLLAMKPGTRIVSHQWHMGEWEPDESIRGAQSDSFLWIVPAQLEGRWSLRDEAGSWQASVEFTQRFQRAAGQITIRGTTSPLLGTFVDGSTVGFTFVAPDGAVQSVRAQTDGKTLTGTLRFVDNLTPIKGQRL